MNRSRILSPNSTALASVAAPRTGTIAPMRTGSTRMRPCSLDPVGLSSKESMFQFLHALKSDDSSQANSGATIRLPRAGSRWVHDRLRRQRARLVLALRGDIYSTRRGFG